MKKLTLIISFFLTLPNIYAITREEILELVRKGENAFKEYVCFSRIKYFEGTKLSQDATFIGGISDRGSVFVYQEPKVDKGKSILQRDTDYFFFFPSTKKYLRMSFSSKLFGSINYGDLAKPPTLKYYTMNKYSIYTNSENEEICIADFSLKDNIHGITYYHKKMFVNITKKEIEKIESYSKTGVLLGVVENYAFTNLGEVNFPIKSKIFDAKNPNNYAIFEVSSVKEVTFDNKTFNPEYLHYVERYLLNKIKQ